MAIVASAAISSGDLVQVGDVFAVALTDIPQGETGDGMTEGVFMLPKLKTDDMKTGKKVYLKSGKVQLAGVAYSRVSTFSGDYLRVTDNKGKKHDVLTGSDDGRHSNTSLAWGAGVQFNPTESVAIDITYEGSGSGDWRTDGFIVGVGYKF
ncbi:TPA: DUF2190 family protein [Escherichia coli]|nr:DUF2190 family protein [Escherichia coli]